MLLNFIFSHLNAIMLFVWLIFFALVAMRFVRPLWVKNISYGWFVLAAIVLHLLYAGFVTWGQYHVWATGSDFTRVFLTAPLSPAAPLPAIFEWTRGYFDQPLGYFAYYAIGRFFLKVFVLFAFSGFFYFLFKIWNRYRRVFAPQGPELLLVLMLIAGWPGVLVLIPLGFFLSVLSFGLPARISTKVQPLGTPPRISIEHMFLIATPFAVLFARLALAYLNVLPFVAL